jgi:hypothetical protein
MTRSKDLKAEVARADMSADLNGWTSLMVKQNLRQNGA